MKYIYEITYLRILFLFYFAVIFDLDSIEVPYNYMERI